jgi:hypothetical protein
LYSHHLVTKSFYSLERNKKRTIWDHPDKRLHSFVVHTNKHLKLSVGTRTYTLCAVDCTDQPAAAQPSPPSGAGGSAAANAGENPQPQPSGSQDNGNGKLVLPQLNRLHEAFKGSQVSHPASSSSQDQQPTRPSPTLSQRRLTQQLTKQWPQFKALRQHYAGMRFEEQRQLHLPQKHKATVPENTAKHWTFTETTQPRAQLTQVQPRRTTGLCLSWRRLAKSDTPRSGTPLSELSYAQSEDRSQATSFSLRLTEESHVDVNVSSQAKRSVALP